MAVEAKSSIYMVLRRENLSINGPASTGTAIWGRVSGTYIWRNTAGTGYSPARKGSWQSRPCCCPAWIRRCLWLLWCNSLSRACSWSKCYSPGYSGYLSVISITFAATRSTASSPFFIMSAISLPTMAKSSSSSPLVVAAGVPTLMPLVTAGLRFSLGTLFLFTVMLALSRSCSTSLPVSPSDPRSSRSRWLSVPPDTPAFALRLQASLQRLCVVYHPLLICLENRAFALPQSIPLSPR